jgi:outer membrane protein assembly factor BamA
VTLTPRQCAVRDESGAAFHARCSAGQRFATRVAAVLLALVAAGCAADRRPPACTRPDLGGCAIEEVSFEGNRAISSAELAERIATAESAHILGGVLENVPVLNIWDTLTVEYERFDRFVLERDLARIERYYRSRGFYEARVRAARVQRSGDADRMGRVRVHIVVSEGQPVNVASVNLQWKDWNLQKGKDVVRPVTEAQGNLKVGARFEEEEYEATKKALLRVMTDRGFAYAAVQGHADVDLMKREARVTYTIELGPETYFGRIKLEGLGELPEGPLRAALDIEEGDRFSTEALEDAERVLADFGVFGAIDVKPELAAPGQPKNPVIPVTFTVQPAALRAVKLGGGAELGGQVEAHLVAGWEDRNFLGGLRRFSIEGKPGLVLYPTQLNTLFAKAPTNVLPELALRFELRQPAAIERRTTAVLRGAFQRYCPQTGACSPDVLKKPPEDIVGYDEYAGTIGLERPFLRSDLNTALLYNVQINDPFSYNTDAPPPSFDESLLIPYVEVLVSYDLRRNVAGKPDRVNPHHGIYVAADAQVAGYPFGDVETIQIPKDVRIQPEFRAYMPVSKKVTLGFRLLTGFLFPQNYGSELSKQDLPDTSPRGEASDACQPSREELGNDLQVSQLRAFFSGGASSNRGYGYNEIGPHVTLQSAGQNGTPTKCSIPSGGLSLWESSLELRIPVVGSFSTAIFLDASDVTSRTWSFRLKRPHLSAGFGLRYETPVGPLRADLGYRIPCAQEIGKCDNGALEDEGLPGSVLGLPIAVSVAIGEAF